MTNTTTFQTIQELFEAIKSGEQELHEMLPLFDGLEQDDQPDTQMPAWSWSRTHAIVGHCVDDLELVELLVVVREAPNSYIPDTGEREILETGGSYDDPTKALIESDARQLLQGEGGHGKWTVRPWPDDDAVYHDESDVYDFLVDELDVPEDEAERLVS